MRSTRLFAMPCAFGLLFVAADTGLAQQSRAQVAVSEIVEREVASGQTYVGTIMPARTSTVGSAVDGRVAEFPIKAGDFVKQGQTLAQLRTETIALELAAAKAELELRQEELKELENGSRPEEIEQAQAVLLAAEAARKYQQQRLKRAESLFERNVANEDELQLAVSESVKAEQAYAQAEAAHKLAVAGPRPERVAQARLRVKVQQALIDQLDDRMQKHTIVAPFDGYIVAEHAETGDWVEQGQQIAQIVELDKVELEAHVVGAHVSHLTSGMSVQVVVPALPEQLFDGTVDRVVPQADVRSRTFPVRIRLANFETGQGPQLKSGMLARVMLPTGERRPLLLAAKDALVLGGAQPVVFVLDADPKQPKQGTVRRVPVRLGAEHGDLIQVDGDLKPGETVVVRGNERLRSGQEVVVSREIPTDPEETAAAGP